MSTSPEFRQRQGFIYCADTPEGYIKLGFTINVEKKIRYIQSNIATCWPEDRESYVRMLAFFPATQGEELDMHACFSEHQVPRSQYSKPGRYKHEWYRHFSPAAIWFFGRSFEPYVGYQAWDDDTPEELFVPIGELQHKYALLL